MLVMEEEGWMLAMEEVGGGGEEEDRMLAVEVVGGGGEEEG